MIGGNEYVIHSILHIRVQDRYAVPVGFASAKNQLVSSISSKDTISKDNAVCIR